MLKANTGKYCDIDFGSDKGECPAGCPAGRMHSLCISGSIRSCLIHSCFFIEKADVFTEKPEDFTQRAEGVVVYD